MAGSPHKGLTRIVKAFGYSWAGLTDAYRNEEAFRQEVWLALVAVPAGLWLGQTGTERALLVGSVLLILVVEILNTGIEAAIDRFGGERHELSARAKDMGSAAVLLAFVLAFCIWGLVLLG